MPNADAKLVIMKINNKYASSVTLKTASSVPVPLIVLNVSILIIPKQANVSFAHKQLLVV